jgi:Domain of unknown function (DUF5134)
MSMSMSHGGSHRMSMVGGMAMGGGHGGTNIVPEWAAVLMTLVFIAILITHVLHLRDSSGQRRVWHSGHVLMALGMTFMFAPQSLDHFDIPNGFWQITFANAAVATLLWVVVQAVEGKAVNVLWLVMSVDLGAMAYMFSPSGFVAPLTWVLVAYFAAQALLWGTDRMRDVDHRTIFGGGGGLALSPAGAAVAISPSGSVSTVAAAATAGTVAITTAEPLVCFRDLRVSMTAMTLGMAYMFAAMQLLLG